MPINVFTLMNLGEMAYLDPDDPSERNLLFSQIEEVATQRAPNIQFEVCCQPSLREKKKRLKFSKKMLLLPHLSHFQCALGEGAEMMRDESSMCWTVSSN